MAAELGFTLARGLAGDLLLDLGDDAASLKLGVVAAGFVMDVAGGRDSRGEYKVQTAVVRGLIFCEGGGSLGRRCGPRQRCRSELIGAALRKRNDLCRHERSSLLLRPR